MTQIECHRLTAEQDADFYRLHGDPASAGWCWCVAWWTETWEGFGERSSQDNRLLREELMARGDRDGWLAYVEGQVVGWCQVGPRDRLPKLLASYALSPDDSVWAVTCFFVLPPYRGRGVSSALLDAALADLQYRGVTTVQAFPRRGDLPAEDVWTGPEAVFVGAGFRCVRDDPSRPVHELSLSPSSP